MKKTTNDHFKGKTDLSDKRADFDKWVKLWNKYIDTYLGGINMKKSIYLPQENTETANEYNDRFDHSFYPGYTRKTINDYDKYIWKYLPSRENLDPYINLIRFLNENNEKVEIDIFFRELNRKLYIYGEVFIILDHDEYPEGINLTDNIRIKEDIKYIVQLISPTKVPVCNKNRIIIDLNHSEYIELNHNGYAHFNNDQSNPDIIIYKEWDVLPVLRVYIDENDDDIGESLIRDISNINIELYQLHSSLLVDFKKQTYSPLMLPIDTNQMDFMKRYYGVKRYTHNRAGNPIDSIDKNQEDIIEWGIKEIMVYPAGGECGKFLTKDTKFIDQKMSYIKQLENLIKQLSSQRFDEIRTESGIAKYMDIEDSNTALFILSTIAKETEMRFWELWFLINYNTKVPENISINYNQDFNIKDNLEYSNALDKIINEYGKYSKTAKEIALKEVINMSLMLSNIDKEKIDKEIENNINAEFNKTLGISDSGNNGNNNIDNDNNDIVNKKLNINKELGINKLVNTI